VRGCVELVDSGAVSAIALAATAIAAMMPNVSTIPQPPDLVDSRCLTNDDGRQQRASRRPRACSGSAPRHSANGRRGTARRPGSAEQQSATSDAALLLPPMSGHRSASRRVTALLAGTSPSSRSSWRHSVSCQGRPRRRPGDRSQTRGAVLPEGATLPRLSGSGSLERRDSGPRDCPCFVIGEVSREPDAGSVGDRSRAKGGAGGRGDRACAGVAIRASPKGELRDESTRPSEGRDDGLWRDLVGCDAVHLLMEGAARAGPQAGAPPARPEGSPAAPSR